MVWGDLIKEPTIKSPSIFSEFLIKANQYKNHCIWYSRCVH